MLELADVTQLCVAVTNTLYDEVTEGGCQQSNSSVTPPPVQRSIFSPHSTFNCLPPSCKADVT